ncbi:hypothetical protein BU24DRAFT_114727 [Aaosphaeria arxii CBS 175.79]|uniref:Uncharacterized protein n=1 Tax=Aaosphaeria arxii CBS 175.79 TaxID=1450172 RepID=A0A6A5Y2Z9_9PLEO|nr:uncharacterized protein BU24DRAFT_114727 [Aaosphaeria arxii CBS 175.79]KAF2019180.1 hypothetical protein BU24DRAFT_114727 [Aaosphaeria arxii CBS 175.79]
MVNEDTRPPTSTGSSAPPSSTQNVPGDSGPTLAKTGEIMLIFALVIIFMVIFFIAVHLTMKRRSQRFWGMKSKEKKKKKEKDPEKAQSTSELHSTDKKVFEAEGTAVTLCELPQDAPPLQELEADMTFPPLERYRSDDSSTLEIVVSPADNPWPEGRELAVYWSARL